MGVVRDIAMIVGGISLLTFIALFGHVPALRKTPIGYAHRLLRYKLPNAFLWLDRLLFGGRLSPLLRRAGSYLLNDKHPLVLGMYVSLVTGSVYNFITGGRSLLTRFELLYVFAIIPLPYITLYLAATTDPGIITPHNHRAALARYPFDHINFFPGKPCRTCGFSKPARSKHCSVCKACVARHDHHCVWINNCVGLGNTHYFVAFVLATDLLLTSGSILGYAIITRFLRNLGAPLDTTPMFTGVWLNLLGIGIIENVRVGTAWLLALLCSVLSWAFTVYHLYLIWAGTTTNETTKWADWKEDVADGMIFLADPEPDEEGGLPRGMEEVVGAVADARAAASGESEGPNRAREGAGGVRESMGDMGQEEEDVEDDVCKTWPRRSEQFLWRVMPGEMNTLPRGPLWRRVESLRELDNIYDLGWWGNVRDVLRPGKLE